MKLSVLVMSLFLATAAIAAEPVPQPAPQAPDRDKLSEEIGAIKTQMQALESQYRQLEGAKAQLEAMRGDKKPEQAAVKGK